MLKRLFIFTLLHLSFFSAPLQAAERLVFSAIEKAANNDIGAEVLIEAYKRIGIAVEIKRYPAALSIQLANRGDVDGEVVRVAEIDRKYSNLIMVPVPINSMEGMVFTKNRIFPVKGWKSLEPFIVGIRRGIKFAEINLDAREIISVTDNKQLLEMLHLGRIDVAVLPHLPGLVTLLENKKYKDLDIKILPDPIEVFPLYHYLHKRHAHLLPKITNVLKDVEKEGFIKKVRAQYIIKLNQ